ncbi:MAG: hypothetical protein F3742_09450 [Nitrospinae bacterium]|nr:hypothetical protein [Nitrospinota bacterium]
MKCPACENSFTEKKISGIQVHICSGFCGGFWFSLSQIKKIKGVKPGTGSELLLLEKAEGVKFYRGAEHPCPQCKTTLLYRHFFSKQYDIEVDQCSKCSGFWVDAGGLIDIMKKPENDELIKKYSAVIFDEKISGMNLANHDVSQAADLITTIFKFLLPAS